MLSSLTLDSIFSTTTMKFGDRPSPSVSPASSSRSSNDMSSQDSVSNRVGVNMADFCLNDNQLDIEEEEKVQSMVDMGIEMSQALEALKTNHFDISAVQP